MGRIAVAGATGTLGRTFVDALSETRHEVFAMSRSAKESPYPNTTYHQIDYSSIDTLTTFLTNHNIDTVISAISMLSPEQSEAQLRLIAAAQASPATKRFIPSEYGVIANEATAAIDPYAQFWVDNAKAIEKTDLQYSRISVGTLMDWWGKPKLKTHIVDLPWVFDIPNGVAALPGSGDDVVSMTYSVDLARYVVRLLEEEEWPKMTAVIGQDLSFNELLKVVEETTGKKFEVRYDSKETLKNNQGTTFGHDEWKETLSAFGLLTVEGILKVPDDDGFRLNERFPELGVLTAEQMIKNCWGSGQT